MTAPSAKPRKRRAYAPRMSIEDRKVQLRTAVLEVVTRSGYSGLTGDAISAAAGVTKPVLYSAYPTVTDLLKDVLAHVQQEAVEQLLAAFATTVGRPTAGDVARSWFAALEAHPGTWSAILLAGPDAPEPVRRQIDAGRTMIATVLADVFGARKRPELKGRYLVASEAIMAAAQHFGRMFMADRASVDVPTVAAVFDDLVAGAARAGAARS
jgi:AcrR family transcriptional regulator